MLNQIRVPLSDFAAQGVDLANVRKVELSFGETGKPATGSIQLADVRFQEAVDGPTVYTDKLADVPPTAYRRHQRRPPEATGGRAPASAARSASWRPRSGPSQRRRRPLSRDNAAVPASAARRRSRVDPRRQSPPDGNRHRLSLRSVGASDCHPCQ